MKLPELNSEHFLNEAFDPKHHQHWVRGTRIRRNIYLSLFITGFICIFITALLNRPVLSIFSLFLATISLVIMTKYDTQLFFLKVLHLREQQPNEEKTKD